MTNATMSSTNADADAVRAVVQLKPASVDDMLRMQPVAIEGFTDRL